MSNTLLNDEALKEKLLWDLPDFYEKNSQMVDGYEYKFDKVADYVIELLHSQQQAYADTEMKLISKSVSERTHVGEYGDIVIEVGWIDKIMADIRKNRSES